MFSKLLKILLSRVEILDSVGGGKSLYRPDIDGLRAFACLGVVFFHAFPSLIKGGFVGVDIFFVISGYLISSIIYRNLFNPSIPGSLNIVDFYIRRVRRIFPALIVVLLFCLITGWYVLLPGEYEFLGKHIAGGATYINNIMLYFESSEYFNPNSNAKPLLHLWSLGVEEQFYLIFPIILWLIYKCNLNFVLCLTLFTVGSYLLNRHGIHHNNQSASFYLPWCRFWELSAGAILAYIVLFYQSVGEKISALDKRYDISSLLNATVFRNPLQNKYKLSLNDLVSILGLLTVLLSLFTTKNNSSFPGSRALLPVIGALLVIMSGKKALINQYILSNKIIVFFGLISYPLYLWHWPLLSFAYICEGRTPNLLIRSSAVAIAIVFSILTYYFVEPRLRYGNHSKAKAVGLLTALLLLGYLGYRVCALNGIEKRFPEDQLYKEIKENSVKYADYHRKYHYYYDRYIDNCKISYPNWFAVEPQLGCAMQKQFGKNDTAIIGSSHAAHLFFGLSKAMENTEHASEVFARSGQSCFINVEEQNRPDFSKWITEAYDYVVNDPNVKYVVLPDLAVSWYKYKHKITNETDQLKVLAQGVRDSLEKLKNKKVIIVLDIPQIPFDPSICKGRPVYLTSPKCDFDRALTSKYRDDRNAVIRQIAKEYKNVAIFDNDKYFCDDKKCYLIKDNKTVFLDHIHVNYNGSYLVGQEIRKLIDTFQ